MLSMAIQRTRKNKENPHYGFLVSWKPSEPHVKRELKIAPASDTATTDRLKRANLSEKVASVRHIKGDILRSLITVGIVLTLEVVVYLAWNKFILP